MKHLILIGARGFGREFYNWTMDCIKAGLDLQVKGFLDDKTDALDGFDNYPRILSSVEDYEVQQDDDFATRSILPALYRNGKILGPWRRNRRPVLLPEAGAGAGDRNWLNR